MITTGVPQGERTAPFLFIVVFDYVLQNTEATIGLQTHPHKLLPDLDFEDDIVSLDQSNMEDLEHFWTIESSVKKVGLSIKYIKTKIMIRNIENPRTELIEGKTIIKVGGNTYLEVVDNFKYLSTYIANCNTDFKRH